MDNGDDNRLWMMVKIVIAVKGGDIKSGKVRYDNGDGMYGLDWILDIGYWIWSEVNK